MRISVSTLPFLLLASCFPARPETPSMNPPPQVVESPAPFKAIEAPTRIETASLTDRELSGIRFEGISFDSREDRLIVLDQAGGPGSKFPDAVAAARSVHGIAAANAGFFTPEGRPLGLVVANGHLSGNWNSASSLGSGVWYEMPSGETAICRREQLGRSSAGVMRELIQAGPLLVENYRAVAGLEATKSAVRTLILWDGGTRWWLGRSSPCTLAELANAIANGLPSGWKVRFALNLDGGRSADLWISPQIPGGPLVRRALWNRPVRNFLAVVPK